MQANEKWMVWNKIVVVGEQFEMSLMMGYFYKHYTQLILQYTDTEEIYNH